MRLDEAIEKHKDLISEIEVISPITKDIYPVLSNGEDYSWIRFVFEIFYYSPIRSCLVATDSIKRIEINYKQIEIARKIFGITLWHKKKIFAEQKELLTEEQFQAKIKEDYAQIEAIRDTLVFLITPFLKDKKLTNFQKYGKCLQSEHAWGPWTQYSGHQQRKCYKCKEIETSGFVDGKPVTQAYAESLSCGY